MRISLGAVIVSVVLTSAACALADRLSGVSLAREIQTTGERAEAVVLDVWDTGITVNQDPVVGLHVRVERAGHQPYEATIEKSLVSRVLIPQVQPGCRVTVYVDPQHPGRVALALRDGAPRQGPGGP